LEAKSDLLKSLQIDRGGEGAGGTGRGSLLVAGAAVAIALAVGLGAGWMLRGAKPAPKAAPVAATAPASKSAALPAGSLSASGYVVARRQATVAAETTGRLLEVRIEEGQAVRAGEVLAVLEPTLAEAQLQSAQARTAAAEADLAEAQRVPARSRHDQALAQRNAARSEARRSGAELARYEIRAPFDGVVVNKSAQPGEIISPISAGGGFTRTGVCTIVDMSSLEIEVDVSEAYIARVRQGQKVAAVLDAYPDTTFDAFVIATIPSADRSKATVRVRIGFEKLDPRILPEMAISVRFLDDQA
jgi:HlyD family secretion protein